MRIHIYDFKERVKCLDGFNNGTFEFKLRRNEDENFEKKMNEINEKVGNLGLEVVQKSKKKTTTKPMY